METKCQCLFCSEFADIVSKQNRLAWTTLCRLAFLSLKRKENNEYCHVRDLFNFFNDHWANISHFDQLKKKTWKKSILDALNHSDYFQSGINQFHTNGYWKLMDTSVPSIKNRRSKKLEENKVSISSSVKDSLKKEEKIPKNVFVVPKEERDTKEIREMRELRDMRDQREQREQRPKRENRENRESREVIEERDMRNGRDTRDGRMESHEMNEMRDMRDPRELRDPRDARTRPDDIYYRDPYYGYDYRMYYDDFREREIDRRYYSPENKDFFH